MKILKLFLLFMVVTSSLFAQTASCWNVLLLEKGEKLEIKTNMVSVNSTGFYMYKNCLYDIVLADGRSMVGRLIDVIPDSLVITNSISAYSSNLINIKLDTLRLHYKELKTLRTLSDRTLGIFSNHDFDDYDFIFSKDTVCKSVASHWEKIYTNDSTIFEIVPYLTTPGISWVYYDKGKTYYYEGTGNTRPDRSKMDTTYDVRNVFWVTPNGVEEINGLAVGLWTRNIKNDLYDSHDSLVINGINIQVNPIDVFTPLTMYFDGPVPDSLDIYHRIIQHDWRTKIYGLNITPGNFYSEMKVYGVHIAGLITVSDELHGLSISGVNNFSYIMNGLSISLIRNRATSAKGVQIGLINHSTHHKGVQIGLYNQADNLSGLQIGLININQNRILPFINWSF